MYRYRGSDQNFGGPWHMKPSKKWERFPYKVFNRYVSSVSDCALVLDWTSSHTNTHTGAQSQIIRTLSYSMQWNSNLILTTAVVRKACSTCIMYSILNQNELGQCQSGSNFKPYQNSWILQSPGCSCLMRLSPWVISGHNPISLPQTSSNK